MSQQQQSNYSNVPRMHHEVKETFIESPRFAEAITLPRQPDMAYSNGGYSNNSSSQQARTEPVMQQGITIPRPMHKKPIPSPYENRHVYEKPAPSAFVQLPAKDLSRQDDLEKATKRQNAGKSIMMFVDSNRKNCMYGCIPVDKKKRMICLGITGGLLILLVILGILFFPRMPDFEVLDIKVPPGNSFTLTPVNLASDDLDFKFTLQMTMNINVINPNRYQMKIETLKVSVILKLILGLYHGKCK